LVLSITVSPVPYLCRMLFRVVMAYFPTQTPADATRSPSGPRPAIGRPVCSAPGGAGDEPACLAQVSFRPISTSGSASSVRFGVCSGSDECRCLQAGPLRFQEAFAYLPQIRGQVKAVCDLDRIGCPQPGPFDVLVASVPADDLDSRIR
jgi:hypothetical protein